MGENYEYMEDDFLGKGNFGEVYKGTSMLHNKAIAIKKIRLPPDSKKLAKAMREVELLGAQKHPHPNVMGYLETVTKKSLLYIIMNLCDGNLKELLNHKAWNVENTRNIQGAVSQLITGYEVLQSHLDTILLPY